LLHNHIKHVSSTFFVIQSRKLINFYIQFFVLFFDQKQNSSNEPFNASFLSWVEPRGVSRNFSREGFWNIFVWKGKFRGDFGIFFLKKTLENWKNFPKRVEPQNLSLTTPLVEPHTWAGTCNLTCMFIFNQIFSYFLQKIESICK